MNIKGDISKFSRDYVGFLSKILENFDHDQAGEIADILYRAFRERRCIYFAGNGGSSSTCGHFVNDLNAVCLKLGLTAMKLYDLTSNTATLTAIANDTGYDNVFLNQIRNRIEAGDVLIVISASGRSKNLLRAAHYARDMRATVVGVLGFDGGPLQEICDTAFVVRTPDGSYGPVEDAHLILNHLISSFFLSRLTRDKEAVHTSEPSTDPFLIFSQTDHP